MYVLTSELQTLKLFLSMESSISEAVTQLVAWCRGVSTKKAIERISMPFSGEMENELKKSHSDFDRLTDSSASLLRATPLYAAG